MKNEYYVTLNIPIHPSSHDYSLLSEAMEEYRKLFYKAYWMYWHGYKQNEIYNSLKNELRILTTRYLLAAISDAIKVVKSKKRAWQKWNHFKGFWPRAKPQIRAIGRKDRGSSSSIRIFFDTKQIKINLKKGVINVKIKIQRHHEKWLEYLKERVRKRETSYTVRIIKIKNKPLAQVTFPISPIIKEKASKSMVIGVDFNSSFLAYAIVNRGGNIIEFGKIRFENDIANNMSKGERVRILGKGVKELIKLAKKYNATIAAEDLSLYPIINKRKRLNQIPHSKFKQILISNSALYGIELVFVNPAHTSNIAKLKYKQIFNVNEHCIAAYVIARRALGLIEKIPIQLLEYKSIKKMIPKMWEIKKDRVNRTRIIWVGPYVRFIKK